MSENSTSENFLFKYGPGLGLMIFLLGGLLYQCLFIVPEGQQAVVLQFGKPIPPAITDAGLNFKLPWREARLLEKRVLNWDGTPTENPTKEKTNIIVDTTARWKIVDPIKFIQTFVSIGRAQDNLQNWIESETKKVISSNKLVEAVRSTNDIINARKAASKKPEKTMVPGEAISIERIADEEISGDLEKIEVGRQKLSSEIVRLSRKEMEKNGLELIDVQIKRVALEESVEAEVYTRMITERKRIAAKIRSYGKGKQAEIYGKTSQELLEIESGAYRESQEIKGKAEAEAIKIYANAIRQDPEFYEFIRTIEAYRDGLRDDTKFIMSANSGILKFLQEGLKK
jgi:membrane protease subunit HflC